MDSMIQAIAKVGSSAGLILDQAVLDAARLKIGDRVDISVDEATGVIRVALAQPVVDAQQAGSAAEKIVGKNDELFRRLS